MRTLWFRKQTGCWYFTKPDGSQVNLGSDKAKAETLWHEMKAVSAKPSASMRFDAVCEHFLEWAEEHLAATSLRWYEDYLQSFVDEYGNVAVGDLRPYHLERWLTKRELKNSARRAAITSVKRALNWGTEQGYYDGHKLASFKRPPIGRRDVLIPRETHDAMKAQSSPAFRLFLTALQQTGCRPNEAATVTASDLTPNGTWSIKKHKTARLGKTRTVYLSPCAHTLSRILAHHRPTGPMFRNTDGEPWTGNAVRCAMRRLRDKLSLPAGNVAYSYRHSFTTDAILKGVPLAVVAELLGHSDVKMIQKHYGHLDQHSDQLRAAARKAAS